MPASPEHHPAPPMPAPGVPPRPVRRPSALLLPAAGALYPFAVYFGMERIPAPAFALVLAALWLLRAPALWRQPGGRWLLGAALAYCALLAAARQQALLHWYPTLVSALLLAAFGASLVRGPPMVERIARLGEPELSPAAIPYTRKVTWAWTAFFAGNALASAALSLWAPLRWWTLYNGLLAYLLMGGLFAGEWLLRRRLRRRPACIAPPTDAMP
jgi:uncharacterized membrane protein